MGVGAGLYMYVVVVQKFTFAISSPDEFLLTKGIIIEWGCADLLETIMYQPLTEVNLANDKRLRVVAWAYSKSLRNIAIGAVTFRKHEIETKNESDGVFGNRTLGVFAEQETENQKHRLERRMRSFQVDVTFPTCTCCPETHKRVRF